MPKTEISIPIRTVSEANTHEHWTKKNTRKKRQRSSIIPFLKLYCHEVKLPCKITLTRIAPRSLDESDNLPMSFKSIFDCVCDYLIPGLKPGRADSDERIKVEYKQEKGSPKEYGIRIAFEYL